jgi:hypothetical protein
LFAAAALVAGACGRDVTGPGSAAGTVEVQIASTGLRHPSPPYSLIIDGDSAAPRAVAANDTLQLPAGDHTVALAGIPANCTVAGATKSVRSAPGDVFHVGFTFQCTLGFPGEFVGQLFRNTAYQVATLNGGVGVTHVASAFSAPDFAYAARRSPDSAAFAFQLYNADDGTSRIAVLAGGAVHVLTPGPGDAGADWSPDGAKILYTHRADSTTGELWVINADGSGARRIVGASGDVAVDPRWSPDGRSAALVLQNATGTTSQIATVDLASGTVHTIVAPIGGHYYASPAWDPSGTTITFLDRTYPGPLFRSSVVRVPAAGGSGTTLWATDATSWIDGLEPSPDGAYLASAFPLGGLVVLTRDGRLVYNSVDSNDPLDVPGRFQWAP